MVGYQPPGAFTPELRWERSPYVCVPLPEIFTLHADPYIVPHRDSGSRCETAPPPVPRLQSIALPAQITGITAVTLNPVLRFGAQSSVSAQIDVDFALPEERMKSHAGVLAEPAMLPGLPSLTLLSSLLPWAITVHASSGYVVVADVLSAIHRELDIRITDQQVSEWMEWRVGEGPKQGPNWRKGSREIWHRVASPRSLKYKGAGTRLELLQGRTRFGGLSESVMGCEVWVVNFV
ncbi:hypothetical protein B0H19DRAFT_1129974 [Mycena capillaripes]|nr:hypothetical protein B0H19DRAFT_1129974 [Mycena capillaripes]